MAMVTRVRRLSNPRRVRVKNRRKNTRRRNRKMTPKQIRHFGTKHQRAALKANRKRKRRNPTRRVTVKRRTRRTRRPNPALLVTLGPTLNPRKRRKNVATRKRRRKNTARKVVRRRRRRVAAVANPRRRNRRNPVMRRRRRRNTMGRRRSRRNPTRVVYVTRRSNRRRGRRNPTVLGVSLTSKSGLELVGGVMLGVSATKFIPTLMPAAVFSTLGSSALATTAISGVSAFIAGYIASRFNTNLGAGMYLGGFAQTLSVALNAWLPSVYSAIGSPLSGMGDLVPGRFAVPQNPLRMNAASPMMPAPAGSTTVNSGLGRAYWPAY